MSCDYHRRQLFLYLDGELPSSEIAATQTHLADCDRCRQTYRTQVRLDSLYHQIHEIMMAISPTKCWPDLKFKQDVRDDGPGGKLLSPSSFSFWVLHSAI